MVLAEMAELGAFVSEESGLKALHQQSILIRGSVAQEGATKGNVWLHEPRVVVTNLVSDDPEAEISRLEEAVQELRKHVDQMLEKNRQMDKEQAEILEAYKMFANSRGWMKRMVTDINSGLSAEAAVDKEQSSARARLGQVTDPYMRDRLHDLDDLSNRLLRILTGQGKETGASMPKNPILVASNIGPQCTPARYMTAPPDISKSKAVPRSGWRNTINVGSRIRPTGKITQIGRDIRALGSMS